MANAHADSGRDSYFSVLSSDLTPVLSPSLLRSQLEEVKLAIVQLEKKERILETQLSLVVYPVLTLPPEIVSRIFVACLPDRGPVTDISTSDGALLLLEQWFRRAKKRPLSVTIRTQISAGTTIFRPIISIIPSVAPQLHSLELSISSQVFQFLGGEVLAFPKLKCLRLCSWGPADPRILAIFQNAPSLTTLRLAGVGQLPSGFYPLLTSIELWWVPIETVLETLGRYPRLLHLSVDVEEGPIGGGAQGHAVSAPRLNNLELRGADLHPFTLPGLTRLELDMTDSNVYLSLPPFIARSSCVLTHLSLLLASEKPAVFETYLQSVPSLTSLVIDVEDFIHELLQAFNAHPALLPHLCNLSISAGRSEDLPAQLYEHRYGFDAPAIIRFLRLRRRCTTSPPCLKSIQLNLGDMYEDDWLRLEDAVVEFENLVVGGLEIRVSVDGKQYWPEKPKDLCPFHPSPSLDISASHPVFS
ncbi:hypothetical protein DFH06DRAFT_1315804 [Mycena polygramma]|nr:hypothetical protein DFH06DRAFT_1315804 [Mycena polygramma]